MHLEQITRRVLSLILAAGTVLGVLGRLSVLGDPGAETLVAWPWGVGVLAGLWVTWYRVSLRPGSRPGWALAFSVLAFGSVIVDGTGSAQQIGQLSIVVIMLVFGPRWAAAGVAAFVLGLGAASVLVLGQDATEFVPQAFGALILVLFAYLLSYALAYARDAQLRTQAVVDQLEASSERIRELSLVQERGRTASELHDGLGHRLTAIAMGLRLAERTRVRDPDAAWREVEHTRELCAEALQDLRRWVRALGRFQPGGHRGVAAVRSLADSFDGTTLEVDVQVSGAERPLADEHEVVLYRIVQESLTNVVRHSSGTRVLIQLEHGAENLHVCVHDDGAGAEVPGSAGYGLAALADRLREVSGTLTAGPDPDGGFRVSATLPLRDALVA
ncbi:MAG: sensor histidine kinase [Propionibacteriaceae bacterium]